MSDESRDLRWSKRVVVVVVVALLLGSALSMICRAMGLPMILLVVPEFGPLAAAAWLGDRQKAAGVVRRSDGN